MDLSAIARSYAQRHPDFANGYDDIVKKCELLCCAFLDQCKTTHEVSAHTTSSRTPTNFSVPESDWWFPQVEVLLQTNKLGSQARRKKGEPRKRNAIFEVALLDGHMAFVSHERFQQQLHFIWGKAGFFQSCLSAFSYASVSTGIFY